jgi:hypothetical protein
MNPRIRYVSGVVLSAGLLVGAIGVSGCSDAGQVSGSKKESESRRDTIQKATQSGVPAKPGSGRGGRGR